MVDRNFIKILHKRHLESANFPATSDIKKLFSTIILVLFPEQSQKHFSKEDDLQAFWEKIELDLEKLLISMKDQLPGDASEITRKFMEKIPEVYEVLLTDVEAMVDGDPAATTKFEIIRAYPGFYALAFFRLAHELCLLNVPSIPRILTEYAHSKTGIDIHPSAKIGKYFCMDHGTGIVIGETTQIGNHVKLYQGVTLGALSVDKKMAKIKRHPTIEDHVIIYSGATILGGETVVGKGSIIGGNVWLTKSVPANTKMYHQENVRIIHE